MPAAARRPHTRRPGPRRGATNPGTPYVIQCQPRQLRMVSPDCGAAPARLPGRSASSTQLGELRPARVGGELEDHLPALVEVQLEEAAPGELAHLRLRLFLRHPARASD